MYCDRGRRQLTYCTNIHPANGWGEVKANLERYAPGLKARFSPDAPFGLGLRLSGAEAAQLREGGALAEFRDFLDSRGMYVALLNGYPYGPFSGQPVKAEVFAPDWRTEERVRYTLDLAEILLALLPEGTDGGVSTAPLSYKPWAGGAEERRAETARNVVRVAERLARARQETGKLIHLDIEPEPDGLIETTAETVAFFREELPETEAMREHVRVCYDTCHFAVEYEEPAESLAAFEAAGIQLGRVQVSSALAVPLEGGRPGAEARERLREMADGIYLHQVVERRRDGSLRRYRDLPEALAGDGEAEGCEWRIHFHVPLFAADFGGLGSTREAIRSTLAANPATSHFEIETYTWSVLPENLRLGLGESISREYAWAMEELCARRS